jgi:glutaredoxin
MDKKGISIILILVIIVISVILIINNIQGNGDENEELIQCIADNSQLVVKQGCPACATQKSDLKKYLDKFEIIDCADEVSRCIDLGITHVPTWVIDGNNHQGVRSINELKELTGC